jgi:hypothetical protein
VKKIIRLTESDLNRLVKRIIDEASIPPGLINILNNLDNVVRARTVRNLEGLLANREIDNVISTGTGGTIRISNGDQVLNHFINGRLRSADAEKVFTSILRAADDDEQIKVMVDFLMNQTSFVSKHKGKTKEQIIQQLSPKYGDRAANILSQRLTYKSVAKSMVSLFSEAWGEAWQTPSLLKVITRLGKDVNGVSAWKSFTRWLFTGSTRKGLLGFEQVFRDLMKMGFTPPTARTLAKVVLSLGFEVFQRWLILNLSITILKMFVEWARYYGGPEQEKRSTMELWRIFKESFEQNWPGYSFGWVWPAGTVLPIAYRLIEGILRLYTPGELYDYVIKEKTPVQREAIALNDKVMKELPVDFSFG